MSVTDSTFTALLVYGRTRRDAFWNLCGILVLHPVQATQSLWRAWRYTRTNPAYHVRYIRVEVW